MKLINFQTICAGGTGLDYLAYAIAMEEVSLTDNSLDKTK